MLKSKIYQINVKPKTQDGVGLPKEKVSKGIITFNGIEKDFNNYRKLKKKNTLDMAIMILSMDIINQLQLEGWPVRPGDLGENLTLDNVNYNSLKPGNKYKIGNVELQISFICAPCKKLENLKYVGLSKIGSFIKTLKNRRGWYCKVLKEGIIKGGDLFKKLD